MARVVILSFKENEVAEAALSALYKLQDEGLNGQEVDDQSLYMSYILASGATVEALLARPTRGCMCPVAPGTRGRGGQANWTKTKKFGWFVCPTCKRPHKLVVRNYIKNMIIAAGNNLLPEFLDRNKPTSAVDEPRPEAQNELQSKTESKQGNELQSLVETKQENEL